MRIKPEMVLGLAVLCAGAGLATIVTTSDPAVAEPLMLGLFWACLGLFVWALVAAVASLGGQRLSGALAVGLVWTVGGLALAILSRHGWATRRLSGAIILATISLTLGLWIRSRKLNNKP